MKKPLKMLLDNCNLLCVVQRDFAGMNLQQLVFWKSNFRKKLCTMFSG